MKRREPKPTKNYKHVWYAKVLLGEKKKCIYTDRPKWKWIWNTLINHSSVSYMSTHILRMCEILFTILLSLYEIYQQNALKMWDVEEKNECIFILIFFAIQIYIWMEGVFHQSIYSFSFWILFVRENKKARQCRVPIERRQYNCIFHMAITMGKIVRINRHIYTNVIDEKGKNLSRRRWKILWILR